MESKQASEKVKLVIFVPESHGDTVREILAKEGAGRIGNYDSCSFSTKGMGRFRACEGANPSIGVVGQVETVVEERIETVCEKARVEKVVEAVRAVHPYEEMAYDIYALL